MMDNKRAIKILIEFFKEEFSNDASGVGEWVATGGDDIEELMVALTKLERFFP